jgi:hypothetical protein
MASQSWKAEVARNRLCTNYRIFKQDMGFEDYLTKLDDVHRINLCKFRCGSHRLPIRDSRYLNDNEPKLCTLCNSNDPGDEFHYLLICPEFQNARKKFVKKYYYTRPNVLKMNQLFNAQSQKELLNLAKFVSIIMSTF